MWWVREVVAVVLFMVERIYKAFSACGDFREWEKALYETNQEAMQRLLKMAAEHLDEELMRQRDKELKVVHRKERTLLTPFGEIQVRRRYYRHAGTGEYCYLFDEALGIPARQRLSPWSRELAVSWASELPYHRASDLWNKVSLGAVNISAMELWEAVQTAGAGEVRRAQELREAVFERGEIPPAGRQSEQLNTEADEVWVAGRGRSGKRHKVALKVAVSYEGKEQVSANRRKLRHRRVKASVNPSQVFWEETVADHAAHWDLGSIRETWIGGDGASWIKQGCAFFPGARYRLDRYHLRKALLEGLAHDEDGYRAVTAALARDDREGVQQALGQAQKRHRGASRKRIRRLEGYLLDNWEGIQGSGEAHHLGAIEGQIFHHVARRMKRHGARWSTGGADHLARILAASANDELPQVAEQSWPMNTGMLRQAAQATQRRLPRMSDASEWLQASLPALSNGAAGDPFREVLRLARDGYLKTA